MGMYQPMTTEKRQQYEEMWTRPELYRLIPIPSYLEDALDRTLDYGESIFMVLQRIPLDYLHVMLPANIAQEVIAKMLEAGVTILPEKPEPESIEILWGKHKHEFAIHRIGENIARWRIYHKPTHLYWVADNLELSDYIKIKKKMIDAGVGVIDTLPEHHRDSK
jgi:hypothetical protein